MGFSAIKCVLYSCMLHRDIFMDNYRDSDIFTILSSPILTHNAHDFVLAHLAI